jgi:hypothetical protein
MGVNKFWAITGTGNWNPSTNPLVPFVGNIGTTGVTGVSSSVISAINALGATNVRIQELGVRVASAAGDTIVLGATYTGGYTGSQSLNYCNGARPVAGLDGPIVGILPTAASPANFAILDANGNTATFPAGSLKQGAIYPLEIGQIITVTSGDFLGMSDI